MSQEKVDRYKEYKANKDKILKREKIIRRLELGASAIVAVAFVVWIGFSVVTKVNEAPAEDTTNPVVTEIDATSIDDYLSTLQTTE